MKPGRQELLSYSRHSQPYVEPEGSYPCSQDPTTDLYPEPDEFSQLPPSHSSQIHFNIILPSTARLS
jgi:hypothetical protein